LKICKTKYIDNNSKIIPLIILKHCNLENGWKQNLLQNKMCQFQPSSISTINKPFVEGTEYKQLNN
jgi:hypothetical protein